MKTYKPKSTVTVRAGKIVKFNTYRIGEVHLHAVLDDGSEHPITDEMQSRMNPVAGDYLVFAPNPDGATDYVYLNPCAVFEAKYEEVGCDIAQQHNPFPRVTNLDKPVAYDDQVRPPKQGEIVAYHHPGSLDGRYPPQTSPAMVQQVNAVQSVNDTGLRCHLFVFGPKGQHMDWCEYGHGPSQWSYR